MAPGETCQPSPVGSSYARHVPLREFPVEWYRGIKHATHVIDTWHVPFRQVPVKWFRAREHEPHVCDAWHVPIRDLTIKQSTTGKHLFRSCRWYAKHPTPRLVHADRKNHRLSENAWGICQQQFWVPLLIVAKILHSGLPCKLAARLIQTNFQTSMFSLLVRWTKYPRKAFAILCEPLSFVEHFSKKFQPG